MATQAVEIVQRQYVTPAGTVVEFGIRQGDKVYLAQRTATVMGLVDEARRGWYPVSEQELANYKTWLGRKGKSASRASQIVYLERHADEVIRRGDEDLAKQEEEKRYYQQLEANRASAATKGYGVSRDDLQVGDELEWAGDSSRWIVTEFDEEGSVYARPKEEPTQGGGSLGRGFLQEYKLVKEAGNPGYNAGNPGTHTEPPVKVIPLGRKAPIPKGIPKPLYMDWGFPVYFDEGGYKVYLNPRWDGDPQPYQVSEMGYGKVGNFATPEEAIANAQSRIAKRAGNPGHNPGHPGNPNGHHWYMDIPRNAAAGATGILTGLTGGSVVPLVGLTGGIILQLVEKDVPSVKRLEYWTEGVVDGSVALLARMLISK